MNDASRDEKVTMGPVTNYRQVTWLLAGLLALFLVACGRLSPTMEEPSPGAIAPRPSATAPRLTPEATPLALESRRQSLSPVVDLELVGSGDAQAGAQHPAYVMVELTGRDVSNVSLLGGSVSEDGRRRLLFHRPIDPDPDDDNWPGDWADGIHDMAQTWDFTGDYLWDGQRGDFVVLWASEATADTRTAHGRYREAGSDSYLDAVLLVDMVAGVAQEVISLATGETRPFKAGDEFQLAEFVLDEEGRIYSEPGISLGFEEGGHLAFTRRPAPSGTYFLGISAEAAGGEEDSIYARFEVNNDNLLAGYKAFLDVEAGYQLLYPETWPPPLEQGGKKLFADPAGSTAINVSTHPDMDDQPIAKLKQMALEAYGDVSVLYEDEVEIGTNGGLRTVYGYHAVDGSRTGVMLAFSYQGQAYVIDVDGPSPEEARLQDLARIVASEWAGRNVAAGGEGRWRDAEVDGLAVKVPADHRPQQMSNGWHRFAGGDETTFLAMRSEPATGRGLFGELAHWQEVAGQNVQGFASSEIYAEERGDRSWARVDIAYGPDEGQRVGGVILLTQIGERYLILWTESPLASLPDYEARVLASMVDDLSRQPTERRGSG